jgi:hypothetical protein
MVRPDERAGRPRPVKTFSLQEMLAAAGKRMRADLAERMVAHPGELGVGREEIIRRFLRTYISARFEVSTGFVFDSQGNVSKQLDIIIANSLVCPRFETAGGIRFYPCESVVAVGQVKSSLTSDVELQSALANLESVKVLDRSANGRAFDAERREEIDRVNNHLHQIFTFLLICGKAMKDSTMQTKFMDRVLVSAPHVWTNIILALDQYLITFHCNDGVCPNPKDARGIALQRTSEDDELLMRFYLLLGQAIEVTRVSSLPHWEYLSAAKMWNAEVHCAVPDDPDLPPPLLSKVTTG